VIVETAKFWHSRVERDAAGQYHMHDIVGPDEYNRHANDNYYTNYLAAWNMRQAVAAMERLREDDPEQYRRVAASTGWDATLPAALRDAAEHMAYPSVRDGVCEQHRGYFQLKDVPPLRRGPHNMPVVDGHAYGSGTQMNKQADVVLMHFLFGDDFAPATQRASYEYYDRRCSQGSSLSPAIFSIMGLRVGLPEHAYGYFEATALLDIRNLHVDRNLHEGIHAACAGGTWQAAVFGYGGVALRHGSLAIEPRLPAAWQSLGFSLLFRGRRLDVAATRADVRVRLQGAPLDVTIAGTLVRLTEGQEHAGAWRAP